MQKNPFDKNELYSWYMVSRKKDLESPVRVNRKQELVGVSDMSGGNGMVGIAYLTEEDSNDLKENIDKYCKDSKYDDAFWEEALYKKNRMSISAKVVSEEEVIEINTFEQLRELDSDSNNLKSEAIETITQALGVKAKDIIDITVLKKGMTNRSFLFRCKEKKYIMRIPGEGTEQLINRKAEAAVYRRINGKGICDEIAYINPENGYKITEYIEGARVCDPLNDDDIKRCMHKLREFHEQKMIVEHEFDLFGQIEFYETLWEGIPSVYKDYKNERTCIEFKKIHK